MKPHRSLPHHQHGLTLVELMIGLMVGMLIIGAVLYVFLGSRLTYKYNDAMGRIQENGRTAIDMISHDVRMAGFIGCRRLAAYMPPAATGSISARTINFSDAFITNIAPKIGMTSDLLKQKINNDSFSFVVSTELEKQMAGTHSLTVLSASSEIPLESPMASGSSNITTTTSVPAGPAIIADCRFDSLSLSDTTPTGIPAPAEAFMVETSGKTIGHSGFLRAYNTDASVTPISAVSYAIRLTDRKDSTGNAVPALFRNDDELIEGAHDLCVRYGISNNAANEAVGSYVEASGVSDWKRVIAVRIELLLASVDDNVLETSAAIPSLCPPPTDPDADAPAPLQDRRMYKIFSTTVGLRNQVRQP